MFFFPKPVVKPNFISAPEDGFPKISAFEVKSNESSINYF